MCRALPCFKALQWAGYATTVVEDTINGQPVVIQLWKGWCPQFLGLPNFPGGMGAEVGVYRRIPGKTLPADQSFVPAGLRPLLQALDFLDPQGLWWPYLELGTTISFTLTNRETNQAFFTTGPEQTYWLNRWMQPASFDKYKKDTGNKLPGSGDALWTLQYQINGKTYPVW
jgi:hypothetical protein